MSLDFSDLREKMVVEQIEGRGIKEPSVLEAFRSIPRERFVPAHMRSLSYEDHPLSIGFAQTISQPYMVALMTEVLGVAAGEKILEIGTGSGYQAAILAFLGAKVFSIERLPDLARRAEEIVNELKLKVALRVADGTLGWEEEAPFDGMIVTAASYKVPEPLLDQLAPGGRIIIPLGGELSQTLTRVTRDQAGTIAEEKVCGCVFVPLIGRHAFKK
jgi:protein-L-isoaspartate(D-aspartate) O-methyltransferase